MKIGFVPIDNRPVCYTLPKLITEIDEGIDFFIPPREYLGDLTKYADTEKLFDWLENLTELDALVLSLDTLAYGGLISSRRCPDTFEQIKSKIEKLKEILKSKKCKTYAFSSIMRISNNNVNEEEKEYWNKWGKRIFDYSYQTHKLGNMSCINNLIPSEILNDYIETRNRNFNINKIYLEWQKEGLFDTLVFSKDDCAEYGFNVQEAKFLEDLGGFVKTGADEIPLSLLSRAIVEQSFNFDGKKNKKNSNLENLLASIKIYPQFLNPESKDLISNYEDVSIEKSVIGQIELAGCEVSDYENSDIVLVINNFESNQGEIVMKVPTKPFDGTFNIPSKSFMLADVRFANGADNAFVEQIFKTNFLQYFLGYSAWNTSANTLGSLICGALVKYLGAERFNKIAFEKLVITRFLDDWAYQANVRQTLLKPDKEELTVKMKPFEERLRLLFEKSNDWHENLNMSGDGLPFCLADLSSDVFYSFPWRRLFEVEIEFS